MPDILVQFIYLQKKREQENRKIFLPNNKI